MVIIVDLSRLSVHINQGRKQCSVERMLYTNLLLQNNIWPFVPENMHKLADKLACLTVI